MELCMKPETYESMHQRFDAKHASQEMADFMRSAVDLHVEFGDHGSFGGLVFGESEALANRTRQTVADIQEVMRLHELTTENIAFSFEGALYGESIETGGEVIDVWMQAEADDPNAQMLPIEDVFGQQVMPLDIVDWLDRRREGSLYNQAELGTAFTRISGVVIEVDEETHVMFAYVRRDNEAVINDMVVVDVGRSEDIDRSYAAEFLSKEFGDRDILGWSFA